MPAAARLSLILLLLATVAGAQTSPDGTRVPPGNEIVDGQGQHWKLERKIYVEPWNGPSEPKVLDKVSEVVICNDRVYARTMAGQWYLGTAGADWTLVGSVDPCNG